MTSHGAPEVKVVVTNYRRAGWLRESVESTLNQVGVAVHVVIVDDCSNDDESAELILDFCARYPGQVTPVLKARNRGMANSIRLGIETGPAAPYVAFLNEDDRWLPQKLLRQVEMLKEVPELTGCFTEAYVIDADGDRTGPLFSERLAPYVSCEFEQLFEADPVCLSTLVVSDHVARRAAATMPAEALAYDLYLVLLCAGAGKLARNAEPLAEYRLSGTNVHLRATNQLARSTTEVRVAAMADFAELRERVGGVRAARRRIALVTLHEALMRLEVRAWREFLWHSLVILRQRQLRPSVWLVIHGVNTLRGRGPMRPAAERDR